MPELPYARTARERFGLDSILGDGNATGRVQRSHLAVARRIAARVNAARPAGAPSVQAGELAALGLLHDIFHLVVERAAEVEPRAAMPTTTEAVEQTVGPRTLVPLLDAFAAEFPDVDQAPPPPGRPPRAPWRKWFSPASPTRPPPRRRSASSSTTGRSPTARWRRPSA